MNIDSWLVDNFVHDMLGNQLLFDWDASLDKTVSSGNRFGEQGLGLGGRMGWEWLGIEVREPKAIAIMAIFPTKTPKIYFSQKRSSRDKTIPENSVQQDSNLLKSTPVDGE